MNINDLPSLFFTNLFKYFNINERLILEQVCQRWYAEILYGTTSLCLYFNDGDSLSRNWSFTNQSIGYHNSYQLKTEFEIPLDHLKKMKKLCVLFNDDFSMAKYKLINSLF